MNRDILRYTILLCLISMTGTASCSEKNPNNNSDPNKLQSLKIESATLSLTVGETAQFTVQATPETASLENLRWSSRQTQIAFVDDNGKVTAVAAGLTTITAFCDGVTATCEVAVKEALIALLKIELVPTAVSLEKGASTDIAAKLIPENADVKGEIVWESSNKSVVSVDQNGRIGAITDGTAIISATLQGVVGTCSVEVYTPTTNRSFTFFQLNLWEGLSNIPNGLEALIDHLVEIKPDAASFCEFRSFNEAETILRTAAAKLFERTGISYHYNCRSGSGTRGLLTRHPIQSTDAVNDNQWFYRTVIDFYGQEIALYASHAYHSYYACYLPRGYNDGDGSNENWSKLTTGAVTNVAYILQREEMSGRAQIAADFIADSKIQQGLGRLCIFGGDLNQPSHLDWTEATIDRYGHNGCVVPWPISTNCYADGLRDAFREIYKDPVKYPGVTWPVYNKDTSKNTYWAAEADERDRIDYVYFRPEVNFEAEKAQLVGPSAMISHTLKVEDSFADKETELIEPVNTIWPSDHRGVLVTFNVKFPQ